MKRDIPVSEIMEPLVDLISKSSAVSLSDFSVDSLSLYKIIGTCSNVRLLDFSSNKLDFTDVDEPFDRTDVLEINLSNTIIEGGKEGIFKFIQALNAEHPLNWPRQFRVSEDCYGELIEQAVRTIMFPQVRVIMD
jgi:hypothetical protein